MSELTDCVDTWWEAVDSFTRLLESVPEEEWGRPTDLPGWDVFAVAAHVAHLEALLAGARHEEPEVGEAPHARGIMGQFTEQGVVARRDRTADDLITEIRASATARHTTLLAEPPTEPDAPAPGLFGALGWSTRTLLRNRPLDVWMHEQDVRRAVGRPGGMESRAALHTASYLMESMAFVVTKRAKAPAGTTVVVEVAGHEPVGVVVAEDGRGQLGAPAGDPMVRLCTDRESFVLLAGGRGRPADVSMLVEGDRDLATRILDAMAVTP